MREGNAQLKHEVMLENRFSVQPTTLTAAAYIANLQDQSEVLTKKVLVKYTDLRLCARRPLPHRGDRRRDCRAWTVMLS